MAGYTIEDITWTVNVDSDHDDIVTGTIEDVANHLAIVDPKGFAILNNSIADTIDVGSSGSSSVAFDMYNATNYLCNIYPGEAYSIRVKYGIEYLRKVKGSPTEGPGPVCLDPYGPLELAPLFANTLSAHMWTRELLV